MIEILYVLFLLSGHFKSILNFYSLELPVDLTLLTAVLVLLGTSLKLLQSKFRTNLDSQAVFSIILLSIFSLWIIFKLFDSPSPTYKFEKFVGYCTNLFAFIIPFLIRSFRVEKVLKAFAYVVFLLTAWFIPNYLSVMGTPRLYDISGLYLGLGFTLGLVFLIYYKKKDLLSPEFRYLRVYILIGIITLMISLGARGPVFFLLVLIFIDTMFRAIIYRDLVLKFRLKLKYVLVSISVLLIGILTSAVLIETYGNSGFFSLLDRSIYRFELLVEAITGQSEGGKSIEDRMTYINFTINELSNNLNVFFFGAGFGSFGINYEGIDHRLYPHNMFLETWYELGLVGLILLVIFLVYSIFLRKYHQSQGVALIILFFVFLNIMKSSSLSDLRVFFGLISLSMIEYYSRSSAFISAKKETISDRNIPPNNPIT